jgi:hypothetical protein
MTFQLKDPVGAYQPRLTRFLKMMVRVRNLKPLDLHLWKVMDTVAFQDTETALETTLYNELANRQKRKKPAND